MQLVAMTSKEVIEKLSDEYIRKVLAVFPTDGGLKSLDVILNIAAALRSAIGQTGTNEEERLQALIAAINVAKWAADAQAERKQTIKH